MGRVSADFGIGISIKAILILGIVLIAAGAGLWIYAGFKIQELEQTLADGNLSAEDRWVSEGSLQWWRDTSRTIFYPVAFLLFAVGLVVMLFTLLVLQLLG